MKNKFTAVISCILLFGSLLAGCGQTAGSTTQSSSGTAAAAENSKDVSAQGQISSEEQLSVSEETAENVPYIRKMELDASQKELIRGTGIGEVMKYTIDPKLQDVIVRCRVFYDGVPVDTIDLPVEKESLSELRNLVTVYITRKDNYVYASVLGGPSESGWGTNLPEDKTSSTADSMTYCKLRYTMDKELEVSTEGEVENPFLVIAWTKDEYKSLSVIGDYAGEDIDAGEYLCLVQFTVVIKAD